MKIEVAFVFQRDLLALQVSPNRRCLNQLNSWSEHEAAVNGATIAPPPRVSEKVSCPLGKRETRESLGEERDPYI